jgi:peptidoglycan-associated lipoprotein
MRRILWIALLAALVAALGCSHKGTSNATPSNNPTDNSSSSSNTNPSGTDNTTGKKGTGSSTSETTNFIWQDVHFAYDDASLGDDSRPILSATGSYMSKHNDKVLVEGHCDERGSVEYNLALGERRAKSVKDYLVSYGIDETRVSTVSYGKERPLDPGHDETAWAKNRRAHFVEQGNNP